LTIEGAEYYSKLKAVKIVEPTYYPMFVTFTDLSDPKTIVPLLEMKSNDKFPPVYTVEKDYFEKYFGKGVKLKKVEIKMTDEVVIFKLTEHLNWLGKKSIGLDFWTPEKPGSENYLTTTDFIKGYRYDNE
jgi:hypothetical protein